MTRVLYNNNIAVLLLLYCISLRNSNKSGSDGRNTAISLVATQLEKQVSMASQFQSQLLSTSSSEPSQSLRGKVAKWSAGGGDEDEPDSDSDSSTVVTTTSAAITSISSVFDDQEPTDQELPKSSYSRFPRQRSESVTTVHDARFCQEVNCTCCEIEHQVHLDIHARLTAANSLLQIHSGVELVPRPHNNSSGGYSPPQDDEQAIQPSQTLRNSQSASTDTHLLGLVDFLPVATAVGAGFRLSYERYTARREHPISQTAS